MELSPKPRIEPKLVADQLGHGRGVNSRSMLCDNAACRRRRLDGQANSSWACYECDDSIIRTASKVYVQTLFEARGPLAAER